MIYLSSGKSPTTALYDSKFHSLRSVSSAGGDSKTYMSCSTPDLSSSLLLSSGCFHWTLLLSIGFDASLAVSGSGICCSSPSSSLDSVSGWGFKAFNLTRFEFV